MVLANRLAYLFLITFIYSGCSSATSPLPQETEKISVRDTQVELRSVNNECILVNIKTNEQLGVGLIAPCSFIRKKDGSLIKFTYPKKGEVVAIAGKPASKEYISKWPSVSLSDKCADEARGLVFKDSGFYVSKNKAQGGLYCPFIGLDEKIYYGFAYH